MSYVVEGTLVKLLLEFEGTLVKLLLGFEGTLVKLLLGFRAYGRVGVGVGGWRGYR